MKKFKENFKRFWSLQKHSNGGFTLVELIVVIAILAILAGIAVPAYSGYVEKTNKQADQTLVSEVEQALMLAYYDDSTEFSGSAIVCLSTTGASLGTTGDTYTDAAMEVVFGETWDQPGTLALKYDGWASSYEGTSFDGSEEVLISKVDVLTETLGETIYNASGDTFKNFLSVNGLTQSDAGGAAVLYVAQTTANLTEEQQAKFVEGIANSSQFDTMILNLSNNAFGGIDDTKVVAATAAYYAIAEAYNTKNNLGVSLETTNITDVDSAGEAVLKFFNDIVIADGDGGAKLMTYLKDTEKGAAADALAYLDVMNTVNGAKNMVISSGLNDFSSLSGIFSGHGDGNIYIYLLKTNDGGVEVANTIFEK